MLHVLCFMLRKCMLKHPEQRVAVFVDVSNMFFAAKKYEANLNFKEVLKVAVAGRKLVRAIAYAVKANSPEEESFFEALDKSGFEVKLKDLQVFWSGKKKADWDVGIAMDMIKMADVVDVIILVSGDGDYVPVVEYLQNHGRLVEVAAFREGTSTKLYERVDDFLDLSQDLGQFLIRKRGAARRASGPQKAESENGQ